MNISDKTKEQLISLAKTFGTAFIVTAAATLLAADSIEWTVAFWSAIGTAAIRAALSTVIAPFIPTKLGGKKADVVQ